MNCLYPVNVQDKDGTGRIMQVPCGRCINCRVNKASEWTNRILAEASCHKDVYFVTLTYRPEDLPENGTLVKKHLQDFFKRLRKNGKQKIRYYAVGEYGEKYQRPHYHFIVFGASYCELVRRVEQDWSYGFVRIDNFSVGSARYVARYVTKKLTGEKGKIYAEKGIIPEFSLMSRRPGIGLDFFRKNEENIKDDGFCRIGKRKFPIPRYFYNKIDFKESDVDKQNEQNSINWKRRILSHLRMSGYDVPNVDPNLVKGLDILKIITSKIMLKIPAL